jgi:hypothetical protein
MLRISKSTCNLACTALFWNGAYTIMADFELDYKKR